MVDARSRRIRLTGESVSLGANVVFDLSADHVTVVESGELNVFAAEHVTGRGSRHFIASFEPGQAAFGAPLTEGLTLVGIGAAGTVVRELPLDELELETSEGESRTIVDTWISKMDSGVARYRRASEAPAPLDTATPSSIEELQRFTVAAVGAMKSSITDRERRETERLERSLQRDEEVTQAAVQQLAGTLGTKESEMVPIADDPLFEAIRLVADHERIEVRQPARGTGERSTDPVKRIVRASKLRSRDVTLHERWWRTDAGAIFGWTEDDQPVALLPTKRGYRMVNPGAGTIQEIDDEVATSLKSSGLVLYAPWPTEELSMKRVFRHGLFGSRGDITRLALYGVASALLGLLVPIATATLMNSVIPNAADGRLLIITIALVLGAIAAFLFQIAQGIALVRIQTRLESQMQSALWDRLLGLPARFFRRFTTGDLVRRAMAVDQIRQLISGIGFSALLASAFSITSIVLLFVYDPGLALIAVGLLAIAIGVSVWIARASMEALDQSLVEQSRVSSLVVQQLNGIPKLRVTSSERRAFAQWATRFTRQQEVQNRASELNNLQLVFNATWAPLTSLVLFWWVTTRPYGVTDPGNFMAFFTAFGQVIAATTLLSTSIGPVIQAIPLFRRARPIFEELPEVEDSKTDPGRLTGQLELSHVDFRYTADGPQVLFDLSLRVEPHEFVALVGPSGAGKSSMIRLLLGFEKPESGTVSYDGQDLDALDVDLIRRQVGVVLQTAQLTPGSVLSNIVGASGLTRDDAWQAAAAAGLDEDIRNMPMGMETVVVEGGATFSGGQKQRLLIARALASNPRILLFDEATSALDNVTQSHVTESLNALNVTRIVIAHRLSTVQHADRIVVIEHGRIVQEGTFDKLMAEDGPFKELAARQLA